MANPVRNKSELRYAEDDLASPDPVLEEQALDAFLRRNKDRLNQSVDAATNELAKGSTFTLEQVAADTRAQRARRRRKSPS